MVIKDFSQMMWVPVEQGNMCLLSMNSHYAVGGIFHGTGEHQVIACRNGTGTWGSWSDQCWLSTSTFYVAGAMVGSKRSSALVGGSSRS